MATTAKPIATISFNTEAFLVSTLDRLVKAKKVEEWRYIEHLPESDDKRKHFHVWVRPAKRLDTMEMRELFREQDPTNPKPLGTTRWAYSDPENWIMYALHDPAYLLLHRKDESADGKIPYEYDAIRTNSPDDLEIDYQRSKLLRESPGQSVLNALKVTGSAEQAILEGNNPALVVQVLNALRFDSQRASIDARDNYVKAYREHLDELPIQLEHGVLLPAGFVDDGNPFLEEPTLFDKKEG